MPDSAKKPCCICRKWFRPDVRVGRRQRTCGRTDWLQMAEIAVSCGLEAGYLWKRFPDAPHVQNRYGLTLAEIKEICCAGHGIKAVWSELKTA